MNVESFVSSGRLELSEFGISLSGASRARDIRALIPKSRLSDQYNSGRELTFTIVSRLFDTKVVIVLIFEAGRLTTILLQPILGSQTVWAESKEKLKEYADGCQQWLFEKMGIGLPASFSWGTVKIVVNTRSWDTPIVISYRQEGSSSIGASAHRVGE